MVVCDFPDVIIMHHRLGRGWPSEAVGWMSSPLADLTRVEWSCSPSVFLPKPSVLSPLTSCGPRCGQEQAVWSGAYTLAGQGARKPGGAAEAFGDPWGQAKLLEVTLSCCFWEAGGQTCLGTCPLCDSKACFCRKSCYYFFLIGLNGRAFIERLSVKFGCFFFPFLFKTDSWALSPNVSILLNTVDSL